MNGGAPTKTKGTIVSIITKGAGPNSGEIGISLEPVHQSYWVWMDTPRKQFFEILTTAYTAMWDEKTVEITSVNKDGVRNVVSIRVV